MAPNEESEPAPQAAEPAATSRVAWVFVATDDVRARRPADVVAFWFGLLLVVLTALGANQVAWLESLILDVLDGIPSWLDGMLEVTYTLVGLYALALILLALFAGQSERSTARDLALAAVLVVVAGVLLSWLVTGEWPTLLPELRDEFEPQYPIIRIGLVSAVVITAAPHLVRPMRWLGWLAILLALVAGVALGVGDPSDALGALGLGIASAGVVLLAFGSPRGYPDPGTVRLGIEQLGVGVSSIAAAPNQTWGVRRFAATSNEGESLVVEVYGRDARDAQFFARLWRSLWYRDSGPALTSSRLHQVEHEGLLTILAGRTGITTPEVVAVGAPTDELALLVQAHHGTPLVEAGDVPDQLLGDLWRQVGRMHAAGIAHGRLNLLSVGVIGGEPVIANFRESSSGASVDRIQADTAELLLTMADSYGVERSVTAAQAGLGDEGLVAALPYLQAPAVSSEGKSDIAHVRKVFAELREEISARTGSEVPKRVPLRRVTGRTLLMFGLTLLAGYALIGMLAGIDYAAVWEELQDADWGWVAAAFVVAQLPLLADAGTMMSAVAQPIPYMPTVQLQSAIKFIQLAIGGAAGRMATNIAYLRKFGVSTTDSVTQGAVDSLTGFFIQILILLAAVIFGGISLIPDDVSGDINWSMVIGLVLFAVVVSALIVRFVKPVRERIAPPVKQAWDGLSGLVRDPRRFLMLLGTVILSQLLYAFALWLTALAFGWVIPLSQMLVINTITALFAGLLPIPGGVGVSEALLTAGLTAVGVDESAAFAIAVTYRVLSAYLPPVWGWFSLHWLEQNEYL